jgi:hypothetical protein
MFVASENRFEQALKLAWEINRDAGVDGPLSIEKSLGAG